VLALQLRHFPVAIIHEATKARVRNQIKLSLQVHDTMAPSMKQAAGLTTSAAAVASNSNANKLPYSTPSTTNDCCLCLSGDVVDGLDDKAMGGSSKVSAIWLAF
jgi:hypothetical protein